MDGVSAPHAAAFFVAKGAASRLGKRAVEGPHEPKAAGTVVGRHRERRRTGAAASTCRYRRPRLHVLLGHLTDFLANRRLAKALVAGRLEPDFRLSALDSGAVGQA